MAFELQAENSRVRILDVELSRRIRTGSYDPRYGSRDRVPRISDPVATSGDTLVLPSYSVAICREEVQ